MELKAKKQQPRRARPPRFRQDVHGSPPEDNDEDSSNFVKNDYSNNQKTTFQPQPRQQQQQQQQSPFQQNRDNDDGYNSSSSSSGRRSNQTFQPRQPQSFQPRQQSSSSSSRRSSSSSSSFRTATPSNNPEFMWRTSKSIDDLEQNMMKRWGDDTNSFMADPREYAVADESSKSTKTKAYQKNTASEFKPRKVLDPWEKQQKQQRDYYDEDDEGYEVNTVDDDTDAVGKLLRPRPVGGRGSSQKMHEEDTWKVDTNDDSPGYFFNPNAATASTPTSTDSTREPEEEKKQRTRAKQEEQQQSSTEKNPKKKKKKTATTNKKKNQSTPLLDQKTEKPLFLTIDQAERQGKEQQQQQEEDKDADFLQSSSWTELGIHSVELLGNLHQMNCMMPLPVQSQSLPAILKNPNKDVIVGTFTGSGKTLAFLVPLIEQLSNNMEDDEDDNKKAIQAIVVAPGRELASQITSVARELLAGSGRKVVMAIGGTPFQRNFDQIRKTKPAIVVGTPGRIAELVVGAAGTKSGKMKTAKLRSLVLDEFDALLEYKPHRDPTKAILSTLQRKLPNLQTVLCSATAIDMKQKIEGYIRPDPVIIQDTSNQKMIRMSPTILHGVLHVPRAQLALETIRRVLHTTPMPPQLLIFCESSERVEKIVQQLRDQFSIIAAPLHGNSNKQERQEVSQALRDGQVGLVVATELAARGLDAPYLTHVLNLDLPTDASHYAHRAGRCGRGGRPGCVLNFTYRPEQRNVPAKLTTALGVELYTVEAYEGKLQMIEPPESFDNAAAAERQ